MDMDSAYARKKPFKAGMNFICGNYHSAIDEYTELIKETPSFPGNHLYRALAFIQLKDYQKALDDLTEEEKLSKESFVLLFNKGICFFHLGSFIEAKAAVSSSLRFAIEKEQKDRVSVWINKVEIELKEKGVIEPSNTGELKVITNWIQTGKKVTVELTSNHDFSEYEVKIEPKSLALIDKKSGNVSYEMKLTNSIKPSDSQYTINGKKMAFSLEKEIANFNWINLEVKQGDTSTSVAGAYPTSAKAKKNWDKIDTELEAELKDVPPGSNEGMWKLFKDIYERSDEKTRRAMIKSFQTSGGTVLSTNWDEVKDKDYEGKDRPDAPKGQEWAKDEQ